MLNLSNQVRAFVVAGILASLSAGTANAQDAHGWAYGRGAHVAFGAAVEALAANTTSVRQEGDGNGSAIVQTGEGNNAGIRQIGRNNAGVIAQAGSNNTACLIQIGRGLDGAIVQTGENQSAGLLQTRRGNREIPPELCAINGSGRGLIFSVLRRAARSGR